MFYKIVEACCRLSSSFSRLETKRPWPLNNLIICEKFVKIQIRMAVRILTPGPVHYAPCQLGSRENKKNALPIDTRSSFTTRKGKIFHYPRFNA